MNYELNSSYRKDKIELPKLIHSNQLTINSKSWIDNYYKDFSYNMKDVNTLNNSELSANDRKSLEFKLWLEAGKIRPSSLPLNVDVSYNFNMWRNFKNCFLENQQNKNEDGAIIEEVAKLYPVTVPKPSKMNENSIIKYTESTRIISDPIRKKVILEKLKKSKQLMDQLKLKSLTRNPPINEQGNIQPPEGYKKYDHYLLPEPICISNSPKPSDDQDPDVFGRITDKRFKPSIWKLTHKSNNLSYKEAIQYKEKIIPASQ